MKDSLGPDDMFRRQVSADSFLQGSGGGGDVREVISLNLGPLNDPGMGQLKPTRKFAGHGILANWLAGLPGHANAAPFSPTLVDWQALLEVTKPVPEAAYSSLGMMFFSSKP